MGKVVIVRKVEDLEKLRNYKDEKRLTVFILNNINFENGYYFLPINLPNTDVVIYGFNNTINNLNISNLKTHDTGLFGNVQNLYVRNLKIKNAKIKGKEICGILAGYVEHELNVDGIEIEGTINSETISGGVNGRCENAKVSNSIVCTTINAIACLGGVSGTANTYTVQNSAINTTFVPNELTPKRNNLINKDVGYLGSREDARVEALTREVNDYLEEHKMTREYHL